MSLVSFHKSNFDLENGAQKGRDEHKKKKTECKKHIALGLTLNEKDGSSNLSREDEKLNKSYRSNNLAQSVSKQSSEDDILEWIAKKASQVELRDFFPLPLSLSLSTRHLYAYLLYILERYKTTVQVQVTDSGTKHELPIRGSNGATEAPGSKRDDHVARNRR